MPVYEQQKKSPWKTILLSTRQLWVSWFRHQSYIEPTSHAFLFTLKPLVLILVLMHTLRESHPFIHPSHKHILTLINFPSMFPDNNLIEFADLFCYLHFSRCRLFLIVFCILVARSVVVWLCLRMRKLLVSNMEDGASVICREGEGCAVEMAAAKVDVLSS